MTGIYVVFGGMAIFATVITAMDWFGRRQRRVAATPLFSLPADTTGRHQPSR